MQFAVKPVALFLAALVPIAYTAIGIAVFAVNTPFWDEWWHIPWYEKLADNRLTLRDLFAQQNEFRQLFPNIVFVVLGWLSKGDFRLPIVVSFLLACVVSFHVYRLAAQKAFAAIQLSANQEVVLAVLGRGRYPDARWVKSFAVHELPPGEIRLSAWAFDAYTGRAYQLAGTHTVYNHAARAEKGSP